MIHCAETGYLRQFRKLFFLDGMKTSRFAHAALVKIPAAMRRVFVE